MKSYRGASLEFLARSANCDKYARNIKKHNMFLFDLLSTFTLGIESTSLLHQGSANSHLSNSNTMLNQCQIFPVSGTDFHTTN